MREMSRPGESRRRVGLPLRVANWYYKHGLFLSSYPTCATSCAIVVLLFCCYPLIYIPLPGTIPTKVVLPYNPDDATDNATSMSRLGNISTFEPPFPWAHAEPFIYVQQIVLRSSVAPWNGNLILTDAYRAPLAETFKLLELIRNHEVEESHVTLANLCLHVENVKTFRAKDTVFPEYNCLILSPANFWQQNTQMFNRDASLLNTIFQFHNLQKTKVSIAEMLFGISIRDTGVKRYPIRARPRVIQFAVTLILREKNQLFLSTLKEKLMRHYALHHAANNDQHRESLTYIYYPGEFRVLEVMPLIITFVLLFYYVYFSLRKMDLIRSRLLLAFTAVFTVLGSLIMSLGLCFFFGLTISIQSKGIFPYLVVLVGLENVLVITKCITSTDEKLDVKIRVAKGLSNEGWSISKTLLTEITILTVGLATFVPVIQEFCIFAIVGLISDYFLQMMLFSTVLALNIRPCEHGVQLKQAKKDTGAASGSPQTRLRYSSSAHATTMSRSQSHPKLSGLMLDSVNHISTDVIPTPSVTDRKIPKRVKIVNFWARTRFFQRAFMIWMIVWIFSIIYNSNILESLFVIDTSTEINSLPNEPVAQESQQQRVERDEMVFNMASTRSPIYEAHVVEDDTFANISEQLNKLRHPEYDSNHYLSNFHWSAILRQYNISVSGKYVTILPTIRLSHAIAPDVAVTLRNPDEKSPQQFQWKALAVALDPIDFSDAEHQESPSPSTGSMPFYPKSPMEIFLASILCAISIFVLTYTLVVLYRCICTRNYAEWRASWTDADPTARPRVEHVIQSSTPIAVTGHRHRVECLAMDGLMVASSCLEGNIRIWDVNGGELIAEINRRVLFREVPNQRESSPIWCLDFVDNLIAVGCSDGRVEFWEGSTGNLKCVLDDEKKVRNGVTHIKLSGDRVIVARLCGRVDFLRLETYSQGKQIDWGFTSAYRRTHIRTGSTGSLAMIHHSTATGEELRCIVEIQHKAHQQSITCLEVMHGTVFTGSQDNTLKVFRLDNRSLQYTLHGHYGPITCLFIDQNHYGTGGSGSQEGLLCVWDLTSGACVYGIQAHDGAIVSLVCSPSYVISLGADERLCIWERFQGHLLNSINVLYAYSILLMLTPSLLITTKPGSLIVWDVRTGEPTREVKLDSANSQLCPRLVLASSDCVICDYGNELRIIRFPLTAGKMD
ncbi:sterol regulatory element-binding protein cleavage-activating protein [Phlebotomus argentipes]|uniref:sterol regulatory element-binding protein cleavage-activating protein n=1 Tax=Phlebotomus argentipes TaxID=94469 RepID=UPI0028935B02|nr:sterol regulatory element-binding protein cleavage-activating protein [Phlebotomus argentipes]